MEKPVLKNMTIDEMKDFMAGIGEKPFRGRQVFEWIYKGAGSFEDMRNLPKTLREKLAQTTVFENIRIVEVQESKTDGTRKYLFEMPDGEKIESVFMKYRYGNSICISSQAGCAMGCRFCASAIGGLRRNLESWEMAAQLLAVEKDTGERIGHIVIMGTGEPFHNYENAARFLKLVNSPEGLNISMRNITVSTCGLTDGIKKFAKDFPQATLAISLHAPSDEIRSEMMPVNNRYPVKEVIAAAGEYAQETGRRVTFEYALVKGVNDSMEHADMLADRLKGILCHVNLIPLNEVKETGLTGADRKHAESFRARLEQRGIPATVRRELGSDIDAACGQLRNKK